MTADRRAFEKWATEAENREFSGWDFAYIRERWHEDDPPWSYREIVLEFIVTARHMLDMGTGGGEFLSTLAPFTAKVQATEGYPPNLAIARERLAPLGIPVTAVTDDGHLPFPDATFDLVINRHEFYLPAEVYRILQPGGYFLTQQVGGNDGIGLNERLQAKTDFAYSDWQLSRAVKELEQTGFSFKRTEEAFPAMVFDDIGAIIYYLKAIPWQIADFSVDRYREPLFELYCWMQKYGPLQVSSHRFLIIAQKPE